MKPFRKSPLAWAFVLAVLLVVYGGYLPVSHRPQKGLPEKAIIVTNSDGAAFRLSVEMAVTPAEREKGLMFRRSIAPNSGMLFEFPKAQVVDF
jgi:hypothetical protein